MSVAHQSQIHRLELGSDSVQLFIFLRRCAYRFGALVLVIRRPVSCQSKWIMETNPVMMLSRCLQLTAMHIPFSPLMLDCANRFFSTGVLACLDGYMNIAMEQTEEYVDGQLQAKYGDCFIRGNNGTLK